MSIDPGLEFDPVPDEKRISQEDVYDEVRLAIPGETNRRSWRVVMLGGDKGAVVFDPKIASSFGGLEGIVKAVDRGQQVKGEILGYRLSYPDLQKYMDKHKERQELRRAEPEKSDWSEPIGAKGRISGPERLEPPRSAPMPEINSGFNPFSRRAR